jgi:hypothetical protein
MPLPARYFWNLDEQPLAGSVLEAGLNDTELHGPCKEEYGCGLCDRVDVHTTRVDENLRQASRPPRTVFPVNSFTKVQDTRPDSESPALVTKTVLGGVKWEGADVVGIDRVADEATSGVGVKSNHEKERQMVSVPESLETLVADLVVGGGVHGKHDQEHEVAGDAAWLRVVNLECNLLSNLCENGMSQLLDQYHTTLSLTSPLNIDEVDVVSGRVNHGPECHGICHLSVEPDVLVGGE